MIRDVAVLGLLALPLLGCATSLGNVGVVQPDADGIGLKMLRPDVSGRSCRSSIVGVPLAAGEPDLREAIAGILALDREGNVVANARVRWHSVVTGLYNRRCVEVEGDLARTVSTITLPAPPSHAGHAAH